jgi:fibronectin-binding autotransporter adhesin
MNKHRSSIARIPRPPGRLARGISFAGLVASSSASLFAASATWDGGGGTNVLNTGTNWTGDAAPSANLDVATWNGTVAGDLSLVWTSNFGPTSGSTGGVGISITGANTGNLTLDATSGSFGLGNVTIAAGAGALTFGDGSGTTSLTLRAPTFTFTNNSSNTATLKSDVTIGNGGGGGSRPVAFAGSGNWTVEGSVFVSNAIFSSVASAILNKSGSGTLTLNGANVQGGVTTISGGTIAITHGSALGTGNVTLSGGRLSLANNITVASSVTGPANYNLSGFAAAPSALAADARILNVSGNNAIAGNINFANVGGNFVNVHSAADTLTLNGNIAATLVTASQRTFNFAGAGNIVSNGVISNGTVAVAISKLGAGTFTANGANTYTGGTTVTEGVFSAGHASALGTGDLSINGGTLSSGVASVSGVGNVAFSSGGLDLGAGSVGAISLASGKTFTMSGGTWSVSIGSTSSYDQVISSGGGAAFSVSDATIALSGISDYSVGYSLFSGFSPGSVSNVSITGYDTTNWIASLGTNGELSFISAVPEPSAFACLAGLAALGFGVTRRRRQG